MVEEQFRCIRCGLWFQSERLQYVRYTIEANPEVNRPLAFETTECLCPDCWPRFLVFMAGGFDPTPTKNRKRR